MRIPFIVAKYTDRPLTNLQIIRASHHPRFQKSNEEMASSEREIFDGPLAQWVLEPEVWKSGRRGKGED